MLHGGGREKHVYDYLKPLVGQWVCVGSSDDATPVHVSDVLDHHFVADKILAREHGPGGFLYRIKGGQSILGIDESMPITPCEDAHIERLLSHGTPYQQFLGQFVELQVGDGAEWGVLRAIYPQTVELLPYTTGRRKKVTVRRRGKTAVNYTREVYLHKNGLPKVIALSTISAMQPRDQKQLEERLVFLNGEQKKALAAQLRAQLSANVQVIESDNLEV